MADFKVSVRPVLAREIERAAVVAGATPRKFLEQVIEVACAERRLSRAEDERERNEAAKRGD